MVCISTLSMKNKWGEIYHHSEENQSGHIAISQKIIWKLSRSLENIS